MKHVDVVRRDMAKVGKIQPDWLGTQGRALLSERKIVLDVKFPPKTVWSERVILEHEKAHFVTFDLGIDDDVTSAQEEMFADWLGLVRTPNKCLHINEVHMKNWILDGLKFRGAGKVAVLARIITLLKLCVPGKEMMLAQDMVKVL
jgi:hypothetical protein